MPAREWIFKGAKFFAFLVGLWTFHWSIDVTLEKYEHDLRSETFQRLERQLSAKKIDGSNFPSSSLATALQARQNAAWDDRIHKLLHHDYFFTRWLYHPQNLFPEKLLSWVKGKPTDEQKRLEVINRSRFRLLEKSFLRAKASLLSIKNVKETIDPSTGTSIDTLVVVGILLKKYDDEQDAAEKLLVEARQIGSTPSVVKALESFRAELAGGPGRR